MQGYHVRRSMQPSVSTCHALCDWAGVKGGDGHYRYGRSAQSSMEDLNAPTHSWMKRFRDFIAHPPADSFIKVVRFLSATTDLRTDFPSDHYVLTSSDRGSTAVPLDLGFKLGEGEGEAGRWSEATQAGCISVQLLPPRLVPCGPLIWSRIDRRVLQ